MPFNHEIGDIVSKKERKMSLAIRVDTMDTISADDPEASKCKGMLRCLECNSNVFFRPAGGKLPNTFVHYSSDKTKFCSIRTKSSHSKRNENLIHTPFNLYLSHSEGYFHLFVRFRVVPDYPKEIEDKYIETVLALNSIISSRRHIAVTPLSLVPEQAKYVGISYADLCESLVVSASCRALRS